MLSVKSKLTTKSVVNLTEHKEKIRMPNGDNSNHDWN